MDETEDSTIEKKLLVNFDGSTLCHTENVTLGSLSARVDAAGAQLTP